MYLTINFINDGPSPQVLAVCNLNIDTDEPEAVKASYQELIPQVHTKDFKGSAANLLMAVTEKVLERHPSAVLVSVNDNRLLATQKNALNVNLQKKDTYHVEYTQ